MSASKEMKKVKDEFHEIRMKWRSFSYVYDNYVHGRLIGMWFLTVGVAIILSTIFLVYGIYFGIILFLGVTVISIKLINFTYKISDNLPVLYTGIDKIDNLDLILSKNQTIFRNLLFLRKLKWISFVFRIHNELRNLSLQTIQFMLCVLLDLRSDLSLRLTEQKQTLESAKSEVESNIQGTTELNQVSELQRARLDKQIEQFEELQRVLVKV